MKKKSQIVSFMVCSAICSAATAADQQVAGDETEEMPGMVVEGTRLSDVSGKEVKSADLAEALFKKVPEVSLVRRSGIANDIVLRGQKKDNINILVDGAKIYGACPNRMDPPTSHILTNNVEAVEITEGPYDVENFGTLSGAVKITTREPEEGFNGEVSANGGAWNYRKLAATLSGGSERVRGLVSASSESSDQYQDGDGRTFAEQMEANGVDPTRLYQPRYRDMEAYTKRTVMGRLDMQVTDGQKLSLSYTANRSDDVLYPTSPMDAPWQDSDIVTADYTVSDLGRWSKRLEFSAYRSWVDHPMSTEFRQVAAMMGAMVNDMSSSISGLRIKNRFELGDATDMTVGFDTSLRNWDGAYSGEMMMSWIDGYASIDDVDTENRALFAELERDFGALVMEFGARYDDTSIEPGSSSQPANDYSGFSAYAKGTWQMSDSTRLFGGVGQSRRVPDARELYFTMPMRNADTGMVMVMNVGNPDLDQTTNREIDFGMENSLGDLYLKTTLFHSWLTDYILFDDSLMMHKFQNVDATIYGISLKGSWNFGDDLYVDFGFAWQKGEKETPLAGQTDTDLPEIPPLKGNIALNWDYMEKSGFRAELVAADAWTRYDADNGEQHIAGWGVVNLKVRHQVTERVAVTAGVDNLFDKTYAVNNTYKDLTLLEAGGGEVMLLNEPGRYLYLNASYSF